ncbi:MAG: adenosine deaminase [Herbiconiux sp.]|nr:adenosine deaminase [Herbiconiux sp.]
MTAPDGLILVDLHRHLEGSIRPSTVVELAARASMRFEITRSDLVAAEPFAGLLPYLTRIDVAASVATRLDDWERIGREVVCDAFDDGLDHLELRFAPAFIAQQTGLQALAVVDAVAQGVTAASAATGLPVGLIATVVRDLGPDAAVDQLALFLRRPALWCGIDLAGDERGHPAGLFARTFATARAAGLRVTAHAGEDAGPQSVRDALDHLGAERIGHGVRAADDPDLLRRLAEEGITLEIALTSNVQTGAAPSYREHPIRRIVESGVRVALSTDDPTVSSTRLSAEYQLAALAVGLSPAQLLGLSAAAQAATFGR